MGTAHPTELVILEVAMKSASRSVEVVKSCLRKSDKLSTRRLTENEFYAVRRAILAGLRQVEIARELNLSVWTIARVADTLRFVTDSVTDEQLPVDDAPPDYVAKNLRRCGGCGAMIYVTPCVACKLGTAVQRVPPAEEVLDDLVDIVGWDEVAVTRVRKGRNEPPRSPRTQRGQKRPETDGREVQVAAGVVSGRHRMPR